MQGFCFYKIILLSTIQGTRIYKSGTETSQELVTVCIRYDTRRGKCYYDTNSILLSTQSYQINDKPQQPYTALHGIIIYDLN